MQRHSVQYTDNTRRQTGQRANARQSYKRLPELAIFLRGLCATFVLFYLVMWQTLSSAVSPTHTSIIATSCYFERTKAYSRNYSAFKTVWLALCVTTTWNITMLRELHWLPMRSRMTFRVAMLCYKDHQFGEPVYLKSFLQPFVPAHTLNRGLLKFSI